MGASGTGKGLWVKQQLRELKPTRLVVWDFLDEYGQHAGAARSLELVRRAMIEAGTDGPLRVRYLPRGSGEKQLRAEFEQLCRLVYAWEATTFVAEELANVTTPGWAPPAWRKMTTSGRHAGVHIIGTSQTPSLIDKTFLGNATLIHTSALREHAHRQAVSRAMDIDVGELATLPRLHWIERDFDSGELRRGRVALPRRRQPAATPTDPVATPIPRGAKGTGSGKGGE